MTCSVCHPLLYTHHTHPPNDPPSPTHAIAIITHTDTSLHYINTPLKANRTVTRTKACQNLSIKQTNKNKRTSRLGDLRLGLPPSQGHPSRRHPSQGSSVSATSVLRAIRLGSSVSGSSVSGDIRLRIIRLGDIRLRAIRLGVIRLTVIRLGAIRLGTSVFETAKAKTDGTGGYPQDGKALRRRAHPS